MPHTNSERQASARKTVTETLSHSPIVQGSLTDSPTGGKNLSDSLNEVTKASPCLHCGKPDWCYSLDQLTVCKRGAEPARGWVRTGKADAEGSFYYAPEQKKEVRPKSRKRYTYNDRNGQPLIMVTRVDDGKGSKRFFQSHWNGQEWVNGLTDLVKANIPIYRYAEVRQAIAAGKLIFVVEGEGLADLLWSRGLAATTTIGGSGKYRSYGSYKADLEGALLVLTPDRDECGVKHMQEIFKDFPEVQWLYAPPNEFYWEHLPESGGLDIGDWIADGATLENILSGIQRNPKQQSTPTIVSKLGKKLNCHGDNSELSPDRVTVGNIDDNKLQAIVTIVTQILTPPLSMVEQSYELDKLYLKAGIERKLFDRIVATERLRLNELTQETEERLRELIDGSNASIDWNSVLPAPLARDLIHDATVTKIDPVVIWQPLLSAVASLAGVRTKLDVETHRIPAIVWTATVLESGGGKSRGDSLVLEPLRAMQTQAVERYEAALKDYKLELKQWQKGGSESDEPAPLTMRKYLFDVATIQSVVRRIADNPDKGILWARDELEGLFNSLGQFSKGSDESMQIMLSLWNGGFFSVDRVSQSDSFIAKDSALSLTGGIQPSLFRRIFEDEQDSNGLQARILFATPKRLSQSRTKACCRLSDRLPLLYEWLDKLPPTTLKLSPEADLLYGELIEIQERELAKTANLAVRAWLSKWSTQVMRISIILHLLESFYSNQAVSQKLSRETLERAIVIGQYYRSSFQFLQEKVNNTSATSSDISGILLQIQDRAQQFPNGMTIREIYRSIKNLPKLAKEEGIDVGVYVEELCQQLVKLGYGQLSISGKSVKYVTCENKKDTTPSKSGDNGDNSAQNPMVDGKKLSPPPVTIRYCHRDNSNDHGENEATESPEEPNEFEELKPLGFSLKAGDHVKCFPTAKHKENNWVVTAKILSVESENSWFLSCTVEYATKSKKGLRVTLTSLIGGGSVDWIFRKL